MRIRCAQCSGTVVVADTGVLPTACPHCRARPVPERLGRFLVVRLLAAGGMGEVYLGEHEQLGTRVALKVLPLAAGVDAAALRERFRREARLTAAIDDAGVVQVLDIAEEQGRLFLVLELVAGRSLRARLGDGPVPLPEAVRIAGEVARVVGVAHAGGVVHRDVKPENVMLCPDGRVRVLDFGIARAVQDQEPLTRTGEILGTPEYMAPEQLLEAADAVDARADVHALGALTYELLTGRSPFAGASLFAVLKLVESLEPPAPSRLQSAVPAAIDAVVGRALQKDPAGRFADGAQFAAALAAAAANLQPVPEAVEKRGRRAIVVALLATATVLLAVVAVQLADVGRALTRGSTEGRGQIDRSTDLARAAAGELQTMLASWHLSPEQRAAVPELLALLRAATAPGGRDTAGATHQLAGDVWLRLGAFHAALREYERARELGADVASGAAVAWHCAHTALLFAIDAPPWFHIADRRRRDRLLALAPEDAEGPEPRIGAPLWRASRELAAGRAGAAWRLLTAVPDAAWTPEHATIALLAARVACADAPTFAAVSARVRARFDAPAVRIAAVEPREAWVLFGALAAAQQVDAADRWTFEFAAAAVSSLQQGRAVPRLRSAAELAWLQGAGGAVPFWFVGVRTGLATRGDALDADEARRLLTLFDVERAEENPASAVARTLLEVATAPDDAAAAVGRAALVDEPCLMPMAAIGSARSGDAAAIAGLFATGRAAGLAARPADDAAAACAQACAALGDRDDTDAARASRRAHWRSAMAVSADLEGLSWFAAIAPLAIADLGVELAAVAAEGTPPPGFAAALRLCARARGDLGPLRERFLPVLTDGVH